MFTQEQTEARIRNMRQIASRVVRNFEGDVDFDVKTLRDNPTVGVWLWFPRESGTYMSALDSHGKRACRMYLEHVQKHALGDVYVIQPGKVKKTTFEDAQLSVENIQEPMYEVRDKSSGEPLYTDKALRKAIEFMRNASTAVQLFERNYNRFLSEEATDAD